VGTKETAAYRLSGRKDIWLINRVIVPVSLSFMRAPAYLDVPGKSRKTACVWTVICLLSFSAILRLFCGILAILAVLSCFGYFYVFVLLEIPYLYYLDYFGDFLLVL